MPRRWITRLANFWIQLLLGAGVRDWTTGFRGFRREALLAAPLDKMFSTGPSVVQEVLYPCLLQGFSATEIPFVFEDRKRGKSKLKLKTLIDSMIKIIKIRRTYGYLRKKRDEKK